MSCLRVCYQRQGISTNSIMILYFTAKSSQSSQFIYLQPRAELQPPSHKDRNLTHGMLVKRIAIVLFQVSSLFSFIYNSSFDPVAVMLPAYMSQNPFSYDISKKDSGRLQVKLLFRQHIEDPHNTYEYSYILMSGESG